MAKMYECLPNRILASIFCTDKKPTNIKHSCPCQPLHLFIKSSKPKTTSQFITIWPPQLIHHHQNLEQQIKNEPRPRHSVFGASKTTSTSGSTTDGRLEDWRLLKSTFLGRFFQHPARWASTKTSCRDRGSSRKARVFMGFMGFAYGNKLFLSWCFWGEKCCKPIVC